LLKYLNNNFANFKKYRELSDLKKIVWIPSILNEKKAFSSPDKVFLSQYKNCISLAYHYLDYLPNDTEMIKFFSWNTKPSLNDVLEQFKALQNNVNLHNFDFLLENVYNYFQNIIKNKLNDEISQLKEYFSKNNWIYYKEKNMNVRFLKTDLFVFKCNIDLSPYYFKLSESLSEKFYQLFKFAGVREEFDDEQ
jgi:hypothetical protein